MPPMSRMTQAQPGHGALDVAEGAGDGDRPGDGAVARDPVAGMRRPPGGRRRRR